MTKDFNFNVLYIAGAGRSGSTLLDIVVGSEANSFSSGELVHLIPNGIVAREPCSCGRPFPDCDLWSGIIREWEDNMSLSISDYQAINRKYLRNKATINWCLKLIIPSKRIQLFAADTALFYQIIAKHTGATTIVDSSKSAHRILLLRKTGINFKVLHLVRRFSHVLGSVQKDLKRNPEAGIEKDFPPFSTSYALGVWLADNFLSVLFSLGITRHPIRYEKFIAEPASVQQYLFNQSPAHLTLLKNRGPFIPEHLCAGSRMRMNEEVWINEKPEKTQRIKSPMKRALVKMVDLLF